MRHEVSAFRPCEWCGATELDHEGMFCWAFDFIHDNWMLILAFYLALFGFLSFIRFLRDI